MPLELRRGDRILPPIDGDEKAIDVPNRDGRILGKVTVRDIEGSVKEEFAA